MHRRPRRSSKPKSPAYQWYPKEAISDLSVMSMTNEEEGLYRRLLDHAWLEDGLPGDQGLLFPIAKCDTRERFAQLWMTLDGLFPVGPDGKRRNERQEEERRKQKKNSRVKKLAAEKRWAAVHNRRNAHADAPASPPAVQVECLALAFALASPDLDQKQEISAPLTRRATPARMRMQGLIWGVRSQLLAAVHKTVALGGKYLDADGRPYLPEIREEVKLHARALNVTWEGRELDALIDAALGRRAILLEEDAARDAFRRREQKLLGPGMRRNQKLG